jgi:uncharacterized protein (TIGR03067 family)
MRIKTFVIVVLALVTATAVTAQDAKKGGKKKDEDRFRGTWSMVSGEKGGEKAPDEIVEKFRLTFKKDGKFKTVLPDKDLEGTYTLDTTKKPKQIDLKHDDKNMEGIYVFEGENLKICVGEAGERPTEFTSPGGTHTMLFVLKRVKTK